MRTPDRRATHARDAARGWRRGEREPGAVLDHEAQDVVRVSVRLREDADIGERLREHEAAEPRETRLQRREARRARRLEREARDLQQLGVTHAS